MNLLVEQRSRFDERCRFFPVGTFLSRTIKHLANMTKHPAFIRAILLMAIAFVGIFLYGLLAALPGSVLPTLERNQFLPNDIAVGTFLLINAIGAVVAYLVSGPIIDRIGKKVALTFGTSLV